MHVRPLVLLSLPALLIGCGGSGEDAPSTLLRMTVDSADFNGIAGDFSVAGAGTIDPEGAIATFADGNRILEFVLPSADPGTYSFGEAANRAQGRYGESGVAGTNEWTATTEGTIAVSGSGSTLRITLREVRFLPESGAGSAAAGTFLLAGTGIARVGRDGRAAANGIRP